MNSTGRVDGTLVLAREGPPAQTVVETPSFIRRAEQLLSEDEHAAIIAYLG
jgi:hypothetical protein